MKNYKKKNIQKSTLDELFKSAKSNGGLNYIFTLVRLEGLTSGFRDPFKKLFDILQRQPHQQSTKEIKEHITYLLNEDSFLAFIVNLVNCSCKNEYEIAPFIHLSTGEFPFREHTSMKDIVNYTEKFLSKNGYADLARNINKSYRSPELEKYLQNTDLEDVTLPINDYKVLSNFILMVLRRYFNELKKYIKVFPYAKLPYLEVLEILVHKTEGLFGFNIHFPNGSRAWFIRHSDATECVNISLGERIGFMIGGKDKEGFEYRMGNKRLYELGVPGRYNKPGEWKPIIYPKNTDSIDNKVRTMSPDPDVQGCLFYVMCTCHHVIEFVVSSNIELPDRRISFGNRFHLHKCRNNKKRNKNNMVIYDGWFELESIDPDYIKSALATIGVGVNRLGFAYSGKVDWVLKYTKINRSAGLATPDKNDLSILNSLLVDWPTSDEASFLNDSVDWYNRGKTVRNVFMQFLCFYISFESIALAVAEQNVNFGLGLSSSNKKVRTENKKKCIEDLKTKLYPEDPIKFINQAYFECVIGLTQKTKIVAKRVFGSKHKYLKWLFEKQNGISLNDIRHKLAHGNLSLLDRDDENLVRERVYEIEQISKEFLTRLIFSIKADEDIPEWSFIHTLTIDMSDPRSTMVVTDEKILPKGNWKIKSQWLD